MGIFHRRPLALGALLFMLSGALAFFFKSKLLFLDAAALIFAGLIIVSLLRGKKQIVPILLLIFAMVCGGFLRSYFYKAHFNNVLEEYAENTSEIEMTVTSVKYALPFQSAYEATLTKIDGNNVKISAIFETAYDGGLSPGSAIRTRALLSDFAESEDGFREKAYNNSKGIFLKATEADGGRFEIIDEKSSVNLLETKAGLLRDRLTSQLNLYMPEDNGLPAAVFLGDRSSLDDTDKMNFRRTGTYHLLALSGMHLSMLATMLNFLLRGLSIRKGKRLGICACVIIFYVALTGFALSVVRAAIMLFISYIAYFSRRENDSLTALMLAGALICAVSPCAISDVGFILSFVTTFGIVAFSPAVESKIIRARSVKFAGKAIYYVLSSLGISVVALLFALPVSWLYFGKVALLSPIGTLLLSPFISALMLLTPLTLVFGSIPYAGTVLGHMTLWTSKGASYVASLLARPDNIELSLDYPFTPFFLIPFFSIILTIIFIRLKHLRVYFTLALAIMLCFFAFHTVYIKNTPISAQFLRRGENEYFIISKNGQNTLIDLSDGSYGNLSFIAGEATTMGYCQIDALILTHYHNRHIASVSQLINNQTVRRIILPQPINEDETDILLSIVETAEINGIETHIFSLDGGFTLFDKTNVLLDRDYIKVSTHPIISLDFDGEINLSYLGSSYASWQEVSKLHENVVVGTHGPVQKLSYSLPLPKDLRLLSFADRGTADLMSKDCPKPPDTCTVLLNPVFIKIE